MNSKNITLIYCHTIILANCITFLLTFGYQVGIPALVKEIKAVLVYLIYCIVHIYIYMKLWEVGAEIQSQDAGSPAVVWSTHRADNYYWSRQSNVDKTCPPESTIAL